MSLKSVASIFVAAIALSGCNRTSDESSDNSSSLGSTSEWQMFTPTDKKFQVLLPGVPTEETKVGTSASSAIKNHIFELIVVNGARQSGYMISCKDYPAGTMQKRNINDFIEQVWQHKFGDLGDQLVFKRNITLAGYPGLQYQYKDEAGHSLISGKTVLVNDRLYQISTIMSNEETQDGYATQFLDSFKVLS